MRRQQRGFTIVELIAAITVLGILGSIVISMFVGIHQSQIATTHLDSATRAGQRQIESMRNSNFNSLVVGEDIDFSNELPDVLPADRSAVAEISEPSPGVKRVDVEISYTYAGREREVKLSSLIGVIGITQ